MSEVNSSLAASRRCLMPVRVMIHSSEVSTIFSRSALVKIFAGTYEPTPVNGTGAALEIVFGARVFEFGAHAENRNGNFCGGQLFIGLRHFAAMIFV